MTANGLKEVLKEVMMSDISGEVLSAVRAIQEDPIIKGTFRVIEEEGGKASGWRIAKSQDVDPGSIETALQTLKRLRVIESTGMGMEGYYYLTSLGFQLRTIL